MKVTIDRIGGFVGFSRFQVDSDDLGQDDRHQLMELVKKNNAAGTQNTLPKIPTNESTVNVTLENHEGKHLISATPEPGQSEELLELIRFVESRGKPRGPSED
ncbi:hypothetical protein GCM10007423_28990 [Dyadobacter endophyticus]|uniref:Uncharacterized protein n=1 Tax=Dyadobacter endophyticus TaxID=1749036 RepID=A0ABQ1YRY8_9BACT|nr:protealysin inhibitor emfourin [Dyadobacter endophyticus]GGH36588.1 hypothetical protein GCM10007423_28990 [Dyadobacter endophyticus]